MWIYLFTTLHTLYVQGSVTFMFSHHWWISDQQLSLLTPGERSANLIPFFKPEARYEMLTLLKNPVTEERAVNLQQSSASSGKDGNISTSKFGERNTRFWDPFTTDFSGGKTSLLVS